MRSQVKPVNYKKEKRRSVVGIAASVFVLVMGLIIALAGLFFYMDAIGQAAVARKREEAFDSWADSSRNGRLSWKTGEIIGLTDEFAADFKETYHYYFAFDADWYPFIIKMKGDIGEEFQPYMDFVYEDGAEMPEPLTVRGVAVPIEEDIQEFAVECLNLLYDEEFVTKENFEDYMGVSLLDTTQKPVGRAEFSTGMGFGIAGVIFTALGILLLAANIKKRSRLTAEEQKAKDNMRRMAAWQGNPQEAGGYSQMYQGGAGYAGGGQTYPDSTGYSGDGQTYPGSTGYSGDGQIYPGGSGYSGNGQTYQGDSGYSGDGQIYSGGSGYSGDSQAYPGSTGGQGTWQRAGDMGTGQSAGNGSSYYVNGVKLTPLKKSNMFLGIIGAIGGSLIGVLLWLGISMIGFIAGIAGFAMLKFALLGYGKLSGRLDKKGAVISLIIAAGMVFFANVLDYVVTICRAFFQWEASLDTVLYVVRNFSELMTEADCWGGFILNLIIGYALSIWSSFQLIKSVLTYKE